MTIEQKVKKKLSPEHLAKLKEGRERARKKRIEEETITIKQLQEMIDKSSKPTAAEQSGNGDQNDRTCLPGQDEIFYHNGIEENRGGFTKRDAFEYMLQHYKTGDFATDYATTRMIFEYLNFG